MGLHSKSMCETWINTPLKLKSGRVDFYYLIFKALLYRYYVRIPWQIVAEKSHTYYCCRYYLMAMLRTFSSHCNFFRAQEGFYLRVYYVRGRYYLRDTSCRGSHELLIGLIADCRLAWRHLATMFSGISRKCLEESIMKFSAWLF